MGPGQPRRGGAAVRQGQPRARRVATEPDFTMADEYLPHATAAVRLLQRQPDVDPARIFVLGHSGGGKVAPRVAAAEPSIAGLVILAGDTAAVERVRRPGRPVPRRSCPPGADADGRRHSLTGRPRWSAAPSCHPRHPGGPAVGWPAPYWLDLRGYDPVGVAAALDQPMLILQGGRDYQVTVADDLTRWQEGLAERPDVTIRIYDADDHLFFAGAAVHPGGLRAAAARRPGRGRRDRRLAGARAQARADRPALVRPAAVPPVMRRQAPVSYGWLRLSKF